MGIVKLFFLLRQCFIFPHNYFNTSQAISRAALSAALMIRGHQSLLSHTCPLPAARPRWSHERMWCDPFVIALWFSLLFLCLCRAEEGCSQCERTARSVATVEQTCRLKHGQHLVRLWHFKLINVLELNWIQLNFYIPMLITLLFILLTLYILASCIRVKQVNQESILYK